jgi:hypothetical protein
MRTWLFAAFLAGAACGGKKDDAPKPKQTETAPRVASATSSVGLFVNGNQVATVDPAKIATWPRVDALVPTEFRKIGTWQLVKLISPKLEMIEKPSENYRDMVPALYPGPGGVPSFGMFDPVELAKHGTPATHGDNVLDVHVKVSQANGRGGNEDNASASSDPTKLVIEIKTPSGASKLTGEELLAMPRETQPGGDAKGWNLQTVLDKAGIKSFEKLSLADTQGTVLPIEKADLSASSIPFVKLNKQGQLRVKVYKRQGEGWAAAGDLRSLASITVLK